VAPANARGDEADSAGVVSTSINELCAKPRRSSTACSVEFNQSPSELLRAVPLGTPLTGPRSAPCTPAATCPIAAIVSATLVDCPLCGLFPKARDDHTGHADRYAPTDVLPRGRAPVATGDTQMHLPRRPTNGESCDETFSQAPRGIGLPCAARARWRGGKSVGC